MHQISLRHWKAQAQIPVYSSLNNDIYVNGSALTIGASPVGMAGNLSFEMRENNSGGDWNETFNVTVNGVQLFNTSSTHRMSM